MAKLQRIVSITDFKLNQLDKQTVDRTLHAQFLLTAYYAAPENLVNANVPAGQVKPGAPPPNGTTPPPVVVQPPAPAAK